MSVWNLKWEGPLEAACAIYKTGAKCFLKKRRKQRQRSCKMWALEYYDESCKP